MKNLKILCLSLLVLSCSSLSAGFFNYLTSWVPFMCESKEVLNERLFRAVLMGMSDVTQNLINKGADVNARNEDDQTPLMCAVSAKNRINVFKILIDAKADFSLQTENGVTALSLAIFLGNRNATEILFHKMNTLVLANDLYEQLTTGINAIDTENAHSLSTVHLLKNLLTYHGKNSLNELQIKVLYNILEAKIAEIIAARGESAFIEQVMYLRHQN